MNYYNENDAEKAAWLRELIRQNVVAPGEVDERSIQQVAAADLRGFRQCHFFAGVGVWSYALRLAGWPDDRPVWTGSCPCPSFSAAGKGGGFSDARHLWPAWSRLIGECRPATIFGEQADDAIGYGWLDLVQTDLERAEYAVGKAVLGACSVGAPHIRQRLYFGAPFIGSESARGRRASGRTGEAVLGEESRRSIERSGDASRGSNANGRLPSHGNLQRSGEQRLLAEDGGTGECADTDGVRRSRGRINHGGESESGWPEAAQRSLLREPIEARSNAGDGDESERPRLERHSGDVREWRGPGWLDPLTARSVAEAGATRGFWRDCDWWHARDEKYRPIERGLFPLVTGASNRVLKLRGYGDAIVPQVAAAFIESYLEASEGVRE